jgi:hypothetical protein
VSLLCPMDTDTVEPFRAEIGFCSPGTVPSMKQALGTPQPCSDLDG